jgi:hypothetical protein
MHAFDECYLCSNGFSTDQVAVCAPTHTLTSVDAGVPGFRSRNFTGPAFCRGKHYFRRPSYAGGP